MICQGIYVIISLNMQKIFKEALNNAWDEYKEPEDRKGNATKEETSFKVAWAAVKKTYHKNDSGNWIKN
jgi:cation transport regulator